MAKERTDEEAATLKKCEKDLERAHYLTLGYRHICRMLRGSTADSILKK